MATKMTFTLDEETALRIDRTAARLGTSKSRVVREAIREYAARTGRLGEPEQRRMLAALDVVLARAPTRGVAEVEQEIREVRAARRGGGRRARPGDR